MSSESHRFNKRLCIILLLGGIIAAFKIWLIAYEEIAPRYSPHDDLLYARLSEKWYWNMPYEVNTLIRAPLYPLWIAVTRQSGLPHRLAAELLYIAAAGICTICMYRIGMKWLLAILMFAGIVFHPASIPQLNQLMREGFYTSVLLLGIAAMCIGLFILPRISRIAWLMVGFAYAVLWHTRDESIILTFHIVMAAVATIWLCYRSGIQLKTLLRRLVSILLLIILPILITDICIRCATWSVHGVAIVEELSSSSFTSAFNALLRVRPPVPIKHVPITRASADMIASQSPSFAILKSHLDDGITARWEEHYRSFVAVPGEVTGGGYMWALRAAARDAGYHLSAREAASFYNQLAREVTDAINEGRLPSRFVPIGMIDPDILHTGNALPAALFGVLRDLFPQYDRAKEPETFPSQRVRETYREYESATLARAGLWKLQYHTVRGWIYIPKTKLVALNVLGPGGEIRASTSELTMRPDLRGTFGTGDEFRCGFSLDMPLDEDRRETKVEIVTRDGSWTVPVSRFLRRGPFLFSLEAGVRCHGSIDWIIKPFDGAPRKLLQKSIWWVYTPILVLACVVICGCIVSKIIRRHRLPALWFTATAIVCGMLILRIILITILDLTWTQHSYRHFFPGAIVFPLILALLAQTFCTKRSDMGPKRLGAKRSATSQSFSDSGSRT